MRNGFLHSHNGLVKKILDKSYFKEYYVKIMKIFYKKSSSAAIPPLQNTQSDAGFDLFSAEDCSVSPFERRLIKTGIHVAIPDGYYGRIAPRSGLAFKNGIDVMAGVVDSGYRGELKVLLINLTKPDFQKNEAILTYESFFGSLNNFKVKKGDRIAQLIIEKCFSPQWEELDVLPVSERSENGFGSSGV